MAHKHAVTATPDELKWHFSWSPSEGWMTVILVAILVLIDTGLMQNMNWVDGSIILTRTTIVGLGIGFVLAKQRYMPQWLADLPLLTLGIFLSLWLTARYTDNGQVQLLAHRAIIWLSAIRSGNPPSDPTIFLLFLSILTMLLGYLSMWLVLRNRNPWLAIAANCIVLLINLNYATDDKFSYTIWFFAASLLLIVRFHIAEQMVNWRKRHLRFNSDITWDVTQFGVIFTLIIVMAAAFVPSGYSNASLVSLWNGNDSPWQRLQTSFQTFFTINGASSNSRIAIGTRSTITGSVVLPNTVILTYLTSDVSNTYLEGVALDHFDGHTWTINPDKGFPIHSDQSLTPESSVVTKVTSTIHLVNAPVGPYVFTVGEYASSNVPVTAYADTIGLSSGDPIGSFTHWNAPTALHDNSTLLTTSYVSAATESDLRAVPAPDDPVAIQKQLYPPQLLARYTQLPDDLKNGGDATLTFTLHKIPGLDQTASMYDRMNIIVAYFKNNFAYSATNPDPPQNMDAAEWLLLRKQGYCTWFATGLAMLAREMGYPARVMQGFTTGTIDKKTDLMTVRGIDSHMWTQVYFPGYGWINFDASPGFSPFIRPTTSLPGDTTSQDPPPPTHRGVTNPPPTVKKPTGTVPAPSTGIGGVVSNNPVARTVAISLSTLIALLLFVLLGIMAWWNILFRALSPRSKIFGKMAVLGRFAGVPSNQENTATEYGDMLAEHMPAQSQAIHTITSQYVVERWSPNPDAVEVNATHWLTVRRAILRHMLHHPLQTVRGVIRRNA